LAQYDHEQRSFGGRVVAHGRLLGAHLEAHGKPTEQGRGTTLRWTPEAYIRQYGAGHLIAERHRQLMKGRAEHRDA
jgi:hypothetical protein